MFRAPLPQIEADRCICKQAHSQPDIVLPERQPDIVYGQAAVLGQADCIAEGMH